MQQTPEFGDANRVYPMMMGLDTVTYLPDDILVKIDRASMAVSLETRVPLLDHRVVEFAWRLPQALKVRDGETKWPLRRVLDRYVPAALTERPKSGFSLPLRDWLRGPLHDWAEDLLAPDRLKRDGYLVPEFVRQQWLRFRDHDEGGVDAIWSVLMFQSWLESLGSTCGKEARVEG